MQTPASGGAVNNSDTPNFNTASQQIEVEEMDKTAEKIGEE